MTEDEYQKIDDYISRPKKIEAQSEWKALNNLNQLETVIQLNDGNVIEAKFSFRGAVNPNARNLDVAWGDLKLFYRTDDRQNLWVTRIKYNPRKNHSNCKLDGFEWSLKKLRYGVCRIYKWEDRKKALKLNFGEERAPATPLADIHTFEAFIEYFKNYLNISGEIKLPTVTGGLFD